MKNRQPLQKISQALTSFSGHLSQENELVIRGRYFYNTLAKKELIVVSGGDPPRAFYNQPTDVNGQVNKFCEPGCI